jgi:NTP pyrophosphatase (non-canonical NTP hydrolase)
MEEAGELGEAIGKYRGMNGEQVMRHDQDVMGKIARELLDVAQTAITMMFVLEEQYGVDLNQSMSAHLEKLMEKGYLSLE